MFHGETSIELLVIVYGLVFGGTCSWLAYEKGRDGFVWFFAGALLGPVGLIALAGAPTVSEEPAEDESEALRRREAVRAAMSELDKEK